MTDKEPNKIPHPKKNAFLKAFARVGVVGRAAAAAKVDRCTPYEWERTDPDFAAAFADAKRAYVEKLEREADRRAIEGCPRMKFDKGYPVMDPRTEKYDADGNYIEGSAKPYIEREYSDTLLIFRLKALDPAKYKDRMDVTSGEKPLDLLGLSSLTEAELDERIANAEGGKTSAPVPEGT